MEKQQMKDVIIRRQRKFLLIIPMLLFPLMTVLLWSLRLIGTAGARAQVSAQTGINSSLPKARIGKDSNWNKLRFYEQADKDSAKFRSLAKNDPYYKSGVLDDTTQKKKDRSFSPALNGHMIKDLHAGYDPYPSDLKQEKDANEEKVYKKLTQLNAVMNSSRIKGDSLDNTKKDLSGIESLRTLESKLSGIQTTGGQEDQTMTQINGMLEKILDIQHPERVTDKLKAQSEAHKQQVFPVRPQEKDEISLLDSRDRLHQNGIDTVKNGRQSFFNGFYSLEDPIPDEREQNAIRATLPEAQTLVSGATVKLRLASDIYINGMLIPHNQFLFGTATLNGERLAIHIASIIYEGNILPVALSVYDEDGMAGIYVPGAITRDVAKQSTDQAIQSLNMAMLDQSVGAQAASAGIEAAKTLIGKKVKLVKVTIPADYTVLLRDDNQKITDNH